MKKFKEWFKKHKKQIFNYAIVFAAAPTIALNAITCKKYKEKKEAKAIEIEQEIYTIAQGLAFNGQEYQKEDQANENAEVVYYMDFILKFEYTGGRFAIIIDQYETKNYAKCQGEFTVENKNYYDFVMNMAWIDGTSWGTGQYMHVYILKNRESAFISNDTLNENAIAKPNHITFLDNLNVGYSFTAYNKTIMIYDINEKEIGFITVTSRYSKATAQNVYTQFLCNLNGLSYYIIEPNTIQQSITDAYNNGVNAGLKDKKAYGQQQYNAGYTQGVNAANNYSFENLIFAVIDAPIQSLYGLLNFDLLGINILNLFLALLTTAIMIFILKKVL